MNLKYRKLRPNDQYFKAWQEYRRRHHIAIIPVVAFIFCMVVWVASNANRWTIVALGASFVFMLIFANYAFYWRCPKCQQPFNMDYLWLRYPLNKCCHCGLPRWAADENVNTTTNQIK